MGNNSITMTSIFESQSQALEVQLQGLALPKDATTIQTIVTNFFNEIFDENGEFRQNLTQSEDYILQAAISLLNAQQEFSKVLAKTNDQKRQDLSSNPSMTKKESIAESYLQDNDFFSPLDPTKAFLGSGGGAVLGKVLLGGWGAVFGAIAGTAIVFYLQSRNTASRTSTKVPNDKKPISSIVRQELNTSAPVDTSQFVSIISQICASVDNIIATFRAQINRVVAKYENIEKPTLERDYRFLLESIQSLIGYERTHTEDEKYAKKIQERIEDLGEALDNYNLSIENYSGENEQFFEIIKSPNTKQPKMVYPAILKSGNAVLKGKVFIPE